MKLKLSLAFLLASLALAQNPVTRTSSSSNNTAAKFTAASQVGTSSITDNGSIVALGESTTLGANALMSQYANASSTGTTVNTLTKLNASRQAVIIATTDTTNIYGICLSGCGTTGSSQLAFSGQGACLFDNQTVVNDFVVASTSVGGDCDDAGTTEPSGVQVIGRVITANTGGGTVANVALYSPDVINASPLIKTLTIANAGSTGTTLNKLAKLTGAPSTAVITAISDTEGAVGIVSAGAGTTGSATIVQNGAASCVFDGATTAGDYVQISATTAGDCLDSGANYPANGEVIGRVLSTNGSGGTYGIVMGTPDVQAANSAQHVITFNLDGGGGVIATGALNQFPSVNYACNITAAMISSDQSGSITMDVWKRAGAIPTSSNKISAVAPVTLSAAQLNQASPLTGWTKTVAIGDVFGASVATSTTVTKATVQLWCQ